MNEKTQPQTQSAPTAKQRVLALAQKVLDTKIAVVEATPMPTTAALDELVHVYHTVQTIKTGK